MKLVMRQNTSFLALLLAVAVLLSACSSDDTNTTPAPSDDSSEIWAYYFPADQYNITGKLKMYYQDYNNPLVPTPAQN